METAIHICESELYHKNETNIYQSVFNVNAYVLLGYLTKFYGCDDIFPYGELYGVLENRRKYLLNVILENGVLEDSEVFYLAIISKECLSEEDAALVQKIIEEQVLMQEVVIEKVRYRFLISAVNRLSDEFQEKFVQHEFSRIGNMLRERRIEWTQAECIVTEIACFKGIERYLDFWEKNEDTLDGDAALQLAEKFGWMQYSGPYEQTRRIRELRIRLELAR